MKRRVVIAIAAAAVALTALLAPALGLINTTRLFGTAVASVTNVAVPPLDDAAMVRRGASHYDRVCAQCHGSPDRPRRGEALRLSPPAPTLHTRLGDRPPEALFLTVLHGVSGSGMPAWPAPFREDEVWDVVAFLARLPTLDAATYRDLAGVRVADEGVATLIVSCARCHGVDGRGTADEAFPRLDIQSPGYLEATLRAFRDGQRASGFMQSAVNGLTDAELRQLAEHYGAAASSVPGDTLLAVPGPPRTPACTACHGAPTPLREEFPRLDGQYEAYVALQLKLFADPQARRGGTRFAPLMHEVARAMPHISPPGDE